MHVIHIHETIEIKGGAEVYLEQIVRYSPEFGLESTWISLIEDGGQFVFRQYHVDGERRFHDIHSLITFLKEFIETNNIDLINVHGISNPTIIRHLFSLKPIVRSLHEPRLFCPGAQKFFRHSETICTVPFGLHCLVHAYTEGCCNRHPKRLIPAYLNTRFELNEAIKQYARVIVMSDYIKSEAHLVGVPADKIDLNPYFVEPRVIQSPTVKNEKRILFLGRLHQTKGIKQLIESFSILKTLNSSEDLFLDIVGAGEEIASLKEFANSMNLSDSVVFHGWKSRDDVYKFLENAFIVAFPSIYPEAFGIVGIEAMYHRKPVVAFNVGGVSSWLTNEHTGFLVENKNVTQFAEKLNMLTRDEQLYRMMIENGRNAVEAKFLPMHHLESLKRIYSNACK